MAFISFSMPGSFIPEAFIAADARSPATAAFWNATYSSAPGTVFATQREPTMSIFIPCIIAAASGGICGPLISAMFMAVENVNSSHLMPSITWDLPVGLIMASIAGSVTFGAGAAPAAGAAAGAAADVMVAVF